MKATGVLLLAGALVCGVAARAAAQPPARPLDITAGYQLVHVAGDQYVDGFLMPSGWTASVSIGMLAPALRVVGDVNGAYGENASLLNVLGGIRMGAAITPRLAPFGQVLAGLARGSSSGFPDKGFNVQPGLGLDVLATDTLRLRLHADFLFLRSEGTTTNAFRLAGGVVFDLTR